MTNFVKEASVEFLEEALKAENFVADRVELYEDLLQDGIAPERNVIKSQRSAEDSVSNDDSSSWWRFSIF